MGMNIGFDHYMHSTQINPVTFSPAWENVVSTLQQLISKDTTIIFNRMIV